MQIDRWVECFHLPIRMTVWLGALVVLMLLAFAAHSQEATLTWKHPAAYTDDSPLDLNDIEATEIEYGLCPLTGTKIEIAAPTDYTVNVLLPTPGLWCFRARTRLYGLEWSEWTDVVTLINPLATHEGANPPPFKLVM
jgi:hypothetical protein